MLQLDDVTRVYRRGAREVRALDGVTLAVNDGEFLAVKGPSGSGKSTLLLTVGGMIRPTAGIVRVAGQEVYTLSPAERAAFRARTIGFVFQTFHLVPYLSVLENILLPTLTDVETDDASTRAQDLLEHFGLTHRTDHRPSELSIGERQRVAMARALLNQPRLLLADEPTGNLDPANATQVMDHLAGFHRAGGTVLVVTHEDLAQSYAQRTVCIEAGKVAAGEP
jgi:putative ABC transport system ATP-binding protein